MVKEQKKKKFENEDYSRTAELDDTEKTFEIGSERTRKIPVPMGPDEAGNGISEQWTQHDERKKINRDVQSHGKVGPEEVTRRDLGVG